MDSPNLPIHIYKYVSWDNDFHRRMIYENEIFFASAERLNDPSDSAVPLRYDLGTDEQIYERYKYYVKLDHPHLTKSEIERVALNEMKINDIKNSNKLNGLLDKQRQLVKDKYGIFSMTTENNSILMWSHYSNSHKGICVRFNTKNFLNFIRNDCVKKRLLIVWAKVDYEINYPLINPFELDTDDIILKPLLIKSEKWKYENEIRFVLFDYSNKVINIPDDIIDQIILGCKISPEDKDSIIEVAQKKKLELSQSILRKNSFDLEFRKVSLR